MRTRRLAGSQGSNCKCLSVGEVQHYIADTPLACLRCRIEIVRWHRRDGQAKVAGIAICCLGSIIMTFYQGPVVAGKAVSSMLNWTGLVTSSAADTVPAGVLDPVSLLGFELGAQQFGALCLIGNCLCMAIYINLQVSTIDNSCPGTVLSLTSRCV